jgi:SPW repeat
MHIISTKLHAPVDYILGIILIAAPWILGYSEVTGAKWTSIIAGVIMIGSALMTNNELGLIRIVPMHVHLALDGLIGIVLLVAPWIFWYSDQDTNVWLPMIAIGLGEIAAAAMSDPWPQEAEARRREERLVHRTA